MVTLAAHLFPKCVIKRACDSPVRYRLNCVPHTLNDMLEFQPPAPRDVTLYGDRLFTEVTKINKVFGVGPNSV